MTFIFLWTIHRPKAREDSQNRTCSSSCCWLKPGTVKFFSCAFVDQDSELRKVLDPIWQEPLLAEAAAPGNGFWIATRPIPPRQVD